MTHTKLLLHMMDYYQNDPKRIQHFLKVHSFSNLIGTLENLDADTQDLLEVAAIVHDIGIKKAEELYGNCSGKLQEELGPDVAKELLKTLNYDDVFINNVMFLIAHHHTYENIKTIEYQILVEADFLVNLYEDAVPVSGIQAAYHKIFKTKTGKQLCQTLFASAFPQSSHSSFST